MTIGEFVPANVLRFWAHTSSMYSYWFQPFVIQKLLQ